MAAAVRKSSATQEPVDSVDTRRAQMARNIARLLIEKGWTQAELARRASDYMPIDPKTKKKGKVGKDLVGAYIKGKNVGGKYVRITPSADRVAAIAKAFGVPPEDIYPYAIPRQAQEDLPPFDVQTLDDGRVWLQLNQAVDRNTALKILALLPKE